MAGKRKPSVKAAEKQAAQGASAEEKDNAEFASLVAGLKKKHPGKIFFPNEYTQPWLLRRLPTGVMGIDLALNGGLPAGGMSVFVGKEGMGKNYLANCVMANQQRIYGAKCRLGIVTTELVYDKSQGLGCGVRIACSPDEIEANVSAYQLRWGKSPPQEAIDAMKMQIGDAVLVPPGTAEDALEMAIEMVRSRKFNVVLLDSFGSMIAADDAEKTFEENARVGGPAGLNTQFAKKLNAAMGPDLTGRPNLTCLIGINQLRDKINKQGNGPTTHEGGGWAIKHGRWVTIEIKPGVGATGSNKIFTSKDAKEDGAGAIGKHVHWTVTKQKAGGHEGHTGTFAYYYERPDGSLGIDRGAECLQQALNWDVVQKSGSFISFEGFTLGQGADAAARMINANPDIYTAIEECIFKAADIRCNY